MSRLFGATVVPDLHEESFLRVTDADMMILNPIPFEPPDDNKTDITILNGRCCLGSHPVGNSGRKCNMYPMHSVGMKVGLWRKLFPLTFAPPGATDPDSMLSHLNAMIDSIFPDFKNQAHTQHGGANWFMDQIALGCTVDIAIDAGYNVELADGPRDRLHINQEIWKPYTDVHLAGFKLKEHWWWLDNLVDNSIVLMGNRQKYRWYTSAWTKYYDISL
jgi:hypothetical protein